MPISFNLSFGDESDKRWSDRGTSNALVVDKRLSR